MYILTEELILVESTNGIASAAKIANPSLRICITQDIYGPLLYLYREIFSRLDQELSDS